MNQHTRDCIDVDIEKIRVPAEISRSVRSFKESAHFKASEWKTMLIYACPILFHGRVSADHYSIFNKLSSAIRLLLESSDPQKIQRADHLLKEVCEKARQVLQSRKSETINFHALRHLAWQVIDMFLNTR